MTALEDLKGLMTGLPNAGMITDAMYSAALAGALIPFTTAVPETETAVFDLRINGNGDIVGSCSITKTGAQAFATFTITESHQFWDYRTMLPPDWQPQSTGTAVANHMHMSSTVGDVYLKLYLDADVPVGASAGMAYAVTPVPVESSVVWPGEPGYVTTYDVYFAALTLLPFLEAQPIVRATSSEGTSVSVDAPNWDALRSYYESMSTIMLAQRGSSILNVLPIPEGHHVHRTDMSGRWRGEGDVDTDVS